MKRRHEDAERVLEIQSSTAYGWTGPDLTTSGELLMEGKFGLRGAKAPRYVFLFEKIFLLTKQKEDGGLIYKAHVDSSNLMLIESIPGEPLSFHIVPFDNPRLQYTLQVGFLSFFTKTNRSHPRSFTPKARNFDQKREWTFQIKQIILKNYNAVIPSHSMQLVLELGQEANEEKSMTMKKSSTLTGPEYLTKKKHKQSREASETHGIRLKHMINKMGKVRIRVHLYLNRE